MHPAVVVDQRHGSSAVLDRDALALGCLDEGVHQARPAAGHLDGQAAPEGELVVDLERLPSVDRDEPHALLPHPEQRREALMHQDTGELRIGSIIRHPREVVEEAVCSIATEVCVGDLVVGQLRHQLTEILDTVVRNSHGAGRECGVTSPLILLSAFKHDYFGTLLPGCQRSTQSSVSGTHHDDSPR